MMNRKLESLPCFAGGFWEEKWKERKKKGKIQDYPYILKFTVLTIFEGEWHYVPDKLLFIIWIIPS